MMMLDIIVKPYKEFRMKVSKEVAAQNRRRILETATELFKTRGFEHVSVADLTKAAGFTHGGFYNHFESKADLVIGTIRHAFDQALSEISREGAAAEEYPVLATERLASYLSPQHRDETSGGCPTGSLPVDVGRQAAGAQRAFADGLERYIEFVQSALPSELAHKREAAIGALSTLVGGIILSRAVRDGDPDLSDEILLAADATCRGRHPTP